MKIWTGWAAGAALWLSMGGAATALERPAVPHVDVARATAAAARSGVPFVPNGGQWDVDAAFGAPVFGGALFVTREGGLVYALPGLPKRVEATAERRPGDPRGGGIEPARGPGWVFRETLVDATGRPVTASPEGAGARQGTVTMSTGSDRRHPARSLVPVDQVDLGTVYDRIAVRLRATGSNVEKIFTVAPGGDARRIRVRVDGVDGLTVAADGALVAQTGNGPVAFTPPIAYQTRDDGTRDDVPVRYALDAAARTYSFELGRHDRARPLVIDPLLQSTYLGSAASEIIYGVAVHPFSGDIYVTGATGATLSTFPGAGAGGGQAVSGGATDAFVSRFSADLLTRRSSVYFGAAGDETGAAIAIHPITGDIYITGHTNSTGSTLPGVAEGAQNTFGGGSSDAFVALFPAELGPVRYSTYVGSSQTDFANGIAISPLSGLVYIGGQTSATGTGFPQAASGAQPASAGFTDGFVTRLNADLRGGMVSTYFGSDGNDGITAVAVHPLSGDLYAGGYAASSVNPLPFSTGGGQPQSAGSVDGFVARMSASLGTIRQSTYVGTGSYDNLNALAIHPVTGEIYATGYVGPTLPALPSLAGGGQSVFNGGSEAFVSRINATLTTILQSTLFGGTGDETGYAIAIHPASGDVYITGTTTTTTLLPAISNGAQPGPGTGTDSFVARFNGPLTQLVQSTYLGSAGYDRGYGIVVHPSTNEIVVAGHTNATGTTFPGVSGAPQPSTGGAVDGFIARFSLDLRGDDAVPAPFAFAPKVNVPPGTLQTSAPVLVTGLSGSMPIGVQGGALAQFCVATTADCNNCNLVPFTSGTSVIGNNQYVCARQLAPAAVPGVAGMSVVVGGTIGQFFVSTGAPFPPCSLDVDGNGLLDPLTDGMLVMRALFGLTGPAATAGALGAGATRTDWTAVRAYLNGNCGGSFQ